MSQLIEDRLHAWHLSAREAVALHVDLAGLAQLVQQIWWRG